jgi:diguanylate cyclase (GGDEF)-like protein
MQDLDDGVPVEGAILSAISEDPGAKVRPFLDDVAVVPGQKLLDVASALSDGATLMHGRLRRLDPDERDAILDLMAGQLTTIVSLWTDLVRGVVPAQGHQISVATDGPRRHTPSGGPATPTPGLPGAPVSAAAVSATAPATSTSDSHPSAQLHRHAPDRRSASTPSVANARFAAPAPETGPGVRRLPRRDAQIVSGETWAAPLRSVKVDETETDYESDRLTRDELTGVLNRQAGFAALGRELDRCRRAGERFVLGYLNVDGLKSVNSSAGPRGGDELLRKVTAALRATLRSYDVIMRLGGDEFLFSLPGADMATAELRANEFGVILAEEAPGGSASVGFSELRGNDTLDEIISRAEIELVKSRRSRVRSR